ncbi:MAG: hypothetical protein AMXMBFR13_36540 [Phycisphaerae bacterium]
MTLGRYENEPEARAHYEQLVEERYYRELKLCPITPADNPPAEPAAPAAAAAPVPAAPPEQKPAAPPRKRISKKR